MTPFVVTYCVGCHGKDKPKGDLDLSRFATTDAWAKDLATLQAVKEQLQGGTMPPMKAKARPTPEARRDLVARIEAFRKAEAKRNAGDPGSVPARRLSNAEYDHSVRDLTGVDIRPTREFPVDPANEAGFDNSAESLAMSPALVKKYLEAARLVADHLVLKPDGFAFATDPAVADTDRDKYSVRRIIDFYKRQPIDLADYFVAAWQYEHRDGVGLAGSSLDDVARTAHVSPKYLASVHALLAGPPEAVGPIAALQSLWREMKGPDRAQAEAMRDFVVELRGRLVPEVKNLTAPRMNNGSQPLVLWKNRQFAANRRRYTRNAGTIDRKSLSTGTEAARTLALPASPDDEPRYAPAFERFCATFPDAFLVSERARVYLDPNREKKDGNAGRLLSAGFHSMTGYFRDDVPLCDLILDEAGRKELDRLWEEFDFITGAPARQYSSFLWFDRTDSSFTRDPIFDFARPEDKDAASEAKVKRFGEVFLDKAKRLGASETAQEAIRDHFAIINASLRRVDHARLAAEPTHLDALKTFAARAYRRPLTTDERDGIAAFYRALRNEDGLGHEEAVRDSIVGILMSPHFCYRVDLPSAGTGIRPLSDYDLASRLSYFLWSSLPDGELLKHAEAGDLHRPDVLAAQARRMLRDGRVRGLATEFAANWLDIRRFEEHNAVDRNRFPSFDDNLRRAMFEEPLRFFLDVVQNDRSIHEFLDGKHTFVNPALARHYGMPAPPVGAEEWVRVDDAARFGRGGLLPMAVFLTRNAPGLRTSPVKRGYWVVRRLLGENIPPPPADVPELPSDESKLGDLTLREALARHRADKACAGCHERFDAIGLAFEGYGPIGEAREKDLAGHPVDTRATFPGGGEGSGVEGLRAYLKTSRRDEFADNVCRKLLAYGLGRTLIASDDETLDQMRARLAADGGRFGGLVEVIVASPQFRNKRVESEGAE